jgi:hypothetical protein
MERASSEVIAALLDAVSIELPPVFGRCRRALDIPPRMTRNQTRRCQCGKCQQCVENARWERIFAEKFADPNYYTRRIIRTTSPLSSL